MSAIGNEGDGVEFGGNTSHVSGFVAVDPRSIGGSGDGGNDNGSGEPRKRHRRTKAELAAARGEEFYNERADSGIGSGDDKPRRGRKASPEPTAPITADRIAPFIMMFHMTAAARFPEMAMQQQEADQLAEALAGYMKHTKIRINPKTQALCTLIGTVALIEGTRVMAIGKRKAAEMAASKRNPSNIVPLDDAPDNLYAMPGAR